MAAVRKVCVDAVDPLALAAFWAAVLDHRVVPDERGEAGLVDGDGRFRLWFNRVSQPKSVKHRVHLDIYARALADLQALGAAVVRSEGDDRRWTVMTDPEGGEFCAFLRAELPARRLHGLVVDCADPLAAARWWHGVLGGRYIAQDGYATVSDLVGLPEMTMDFVPVPEPKTAANRIHWDVTVERLEPLLAAGATVLRPRGGDIAWHVLADPEGNEFCAFDAQ